MYPPRPDHALDEAFMDQALALGRRGLGRTWPNPSVGAIVLGPAGQVVGRGFTAPSGRPHGEAIAFDRAGPAAAGGTLYVTLEPCSHRTLRGHVPCVERTILSGVRRVVSAMHDPNPLIAGLGHALLRTAGISVTVGVRNAEAQRVHRGHVLRVTEGRPLVTLKIARTADGFAGALDAAGRGARRQISCEAAGRWVHLQRARHDVIMVGVSTVIADDPQLTVRLSGMAEMSPVRVILDSMLRVPASAQVVTTAAEAPTWIIAAETAPIEAEHRLVARGVEVMRVSSSAEGRLDLREALKLLATRGVTRIFSEGGPTVGAELARLGLADEVLLSTSPTPLGAPGVPAIQAALADALANPARYRLAETELLGQDRLDRYERVQ